MPLRNNSKQLNSIKIIIEWLEGEPSLREHLNYEAPTGTEPLLIGTHYGPEQVSFAVAWVGGEDAFAETWSWGRRKGIPGNRGPSTIHHLADPEFFEKFKAGLIKGHNSISDYLKCKI